MLHSRVLVHGADHVGRATFAHNSLSLCQTRHLSDHVGQGAHRAKVRHQAAQVKVDNIRHEAAVVRARVHSVA